MRRTLLLLSPFLMMCAGCQHVVSSLHPEGPAASRIASLSWLMIILFLVVTLIMWVLIFFAAAKRRGTLEEHEPIDIGGGQGWIAVGGFAVPAVILFILFVLGLDLMASFPIHDPQKNDLKPQIKIIGHQWWWEVQYIGQGLDKAFTTANEIHIPIGKPVDIELESQDVIHSFWVPSLHGKVDLVPGHPNFIRVQADKVGTLRGQCAEYCGAQHAHMALIVVAQEPMEYQAWFDGQVKPAEQPTDKEALLGEQVFLSAPCSNCHQVRGTLAGGRVAPDLTHLASRQYIAANSFPNDDAYLEAWVTHAQSLKPEVAMPNITRFNGQELRALVTYLRQLK